MKQVLPRFSSLGTGTYRHAPSKCNKRLEQHCMSLHCIYLFSTTVALRPSLLMSNLAENLKYTAELKESAIPICVRAKQPFGRSSMAPWGTLGHMLEF